MAKPPDILPFPVAITPLPTPSPDDPVGANAFYEALGMALVACGRLEGHFTVSLVMILQIAFFKHIAPLETALLPQWRDREQIWRKAFNLIPELQPYETEAIAILPEMGLHSEDRNLLAHGLWEGFHAGAPYTMSVLNVKKTKKVQHGVEFRRTSESILQLRAIRDRANNLQQELLRFSIPINELANLLFG
jgi:hypothetical protein